MSTRFPSSRRRQPRCRPAGHRRLQPAGSRTAAASDTSAAAKSYVPPGEKDEFYLFYSGGHSGQVYVAGLPSMRHISTIPVFAPYPATGYGFDEESKQMMGRFTWGDVHHPGLSQSGRQVRRPLALRQRQREQPDRAHRPARLQDQADPRPDPELERQPRLVVRDREQRIRPRRHAVLGAAAEGPLRRSVRLQDRVQRHGERHQGRPVDRRDGGRLADPDAAVQLGPRIDRQGTELGMGVLDLLQLRDGARDARGQLDARGARLRGGRELARRRTGRQGRQGRHARRRAGARSRQGPRGPLLPAGSEISARHRHRPVGTLDRRVGQAAAGDQRVRLREDPEGDRGEGLRRRGPRRAGDQVRRRSSRARSRSGSGRCTPSTTARAMPIRRCTWSQRWPSGPCRRGTTPRRRT